MTERKIKGYAVVTGASTGLGKAFAIELASRGMDTVLISLPGEGLEEVSQECRSMGTDSVFYEADLTDLDQLQKVASHIKSKYSVTVLINNAGIGGTSVYEKSSIKLLSTMILLNARATALMTHQLLPALMDSRESYVLNIASLAGLTPSGFKTLYPATKSFIRFFSKGLRLELRKTPVSVSVALLGPMPTRKDVLDRINSQGWLGRFLTISPEYAAKYCLDKMFSKKATIVAGLSNKFSYFILKTVPESIVARIMTAKMTNELKCQHLI